VARPEGKIDLHTHVRGPIVSLACIVVLATACSSLGGSTSGESATLDPAIAAETEQALASLKKMSEFLASRPTLRFESDIQYDAVQMSGQKIEFGSHRKFTFVAPDRARIETLHWDGAKEVATFDGERFSAALPMQAVYATTQYAGTVAEAVEHLDTEYGMASPLFDLVRRDLADDVASRVLSARRIGTVTIEGTVCDHLAFLAEHLDFQLFIRQGEEPVPMRLVIDYHGEPGNPQFRARMHDWDLAAELPDELFRFIPPAGAQQVPFPELLDLLLGSIETEVDGQ
jgi:hypothetical protein